MPKRACVPAYALARGSLIALNTVSLALSLTLVGLAAPKAGHSVRQSAEGKHHHGGAAMVLDDPYAALCLFGALTALVALVGAVGAVKANKHILCCYFAMLLVGTAFLLYAAVFCLVFKDEADYYVASYWDKYQDSLPESWEKTRTVKKFHNVLRAAGALCATAAALDLFQLYAASVVMGHEFALARATQIANFFSFFMGVGVAYMAIECIRRKVGGEWAPGLLVTVALLAIILSCTGFAQSYGERTHRVAVFHLASCSLILLLTVAGMIGAFVEGQKTKRWVGSNWDKIGGNTVSQKEATEWWQAHATLLGVACCFLAVSLILNIVGSAYFIRRNRRADQGAPEGGKAYANATFGDDPERADLGMLDGPSSAAVPVSTPADSAASARTQL